MMMVIIISLKVIICKSAYLKALKFISVLCVCSLTPQPIPSINPFTARVHDGVWSQVDHPTLNPSPWTTPMDYSYRLP